MKTKNKTIVVYAHWKELPSTTLMGWLSCSFVRGKEIFSFEYDASWIKSSFVQEIDPDLRLFSGRQYLPVDKSNFGLFLDSSPDRWGRLLMKRREAIMARIEGRDEETLTESDFLLGVYDEHRMGGLRFKTDVAGPFLNDKKDFATPPWTSLNELEYACLKLEEDGFTAEDPEYLKWVNMLMIPGSSLGGARPKASVVDNNGTLWIAKFPSLHDTEDVGAWEMVSNELARIAGINIPEAKTQRFYSKQNTFLTKRFDRTPDGKRIHFASAMTMLGYSDGIDFHDGVSYLELVEFIIRRGGKVKSDLEELFKRIVFSICISNTDDHLRNHGFILTPEGWILSPAYDINPNPYGTGLKLNISQTDNSLSLDLAIEVAPYFRLDKQAAQMIITKVVKTVSGWRDVARKIGISQMEQNAMANAFRPSAT